MWLKCTPWDDYFFMFFLKTCGALTDVVVYCFWASTFSNPRAPLHGGTKFVYRLQHIQTESAALKSTLGTLFYNTYVSYFLTIILCFLCSLSEIHVKSLIDQKYSTRASWNIPFIRRVCYQGWGQFHSSSGNKIQIMDRKMANELTKCPLITCLELNYIIWIEIPSGKCTLFCTVWQPDLSQLWAIRWAMLKGRHKYASFIQF